MEDANTQGPMWHTRPAEEAVAALGADLDRGLTSAEAAKRLARHGENALERVRRRSALAILVHQFRSLVVGLLVAAGGVAMALGEAIEASAILAVIVINAVIGFITEWKATRALEALRKQSVATARVLRDGGEHLISAAELVPGDVVLLAAGDRIPADGRVVEQARLRVDEAALTGESVPVDKTSDAVADGEAALADRINMVHMGTAAADGRAKVVVTATGAATELGKIGTLLEGVDTQQTPLEAKLDQLSRALLVIVLVLCAVIVGFGWLRGIELLYMVEVGISLAIAAVPEGLLAVTTMTLAVGMQRMAKMNALVRRLPAVEALGSTTVICTDKTGTLTENAMTVEAYWLADARVDVTGTGYQARGEFVIGEDTVDARRLAADAPLSLALRIGALCNDAQIDRTEDAAVALGDPTEAALVVAAEKAGHAHEELLQKYPRLEEVPFDSVSRRMVTVHATPSGGRVAFVKGGPGAVLDVSTALLTDAGTIPLDDDARARVLAENQALAAEALRVLALGFRELPAEYTREDLTRDITFVGLVGMMDPLRPEVRRTVEICRAAGIRTVMITGDQEATASEIAGQLGIDVDAEGNALRTIHARELSDVSDQQWEDVARHAAVFARVSPEHKLQIVEALQRLGHVVAMTGDGVNDAPALRQADIGIAMGMRGTEVAKEAAAMVITDDDFATIVSAVEQGRIIVHNILRFIHYLFTCNFAEILTVFVAIMLGWPLPLGVLQILWLNLVTDIFPAMALALEPSAPGMMERPPRDPAEPLLSRSFSWLIVWQGALLAACTLGAFALALQWHGETGEGLQQAITISFMTLALAQTFHAFNARSRSRSALGDGVFRNRWLWGAVVLCVALQVLAVTVPALQRVLDTTPLDGRDWLLVLAASLLPVAVVEIVKLAARARAS